MRTTNHWIYFLHKWCWPNLAVLVSKLSHFVSSLITYVVIICLFLRSLMWTLSVPDYRILIGVSFVGADDLRECLPRSHPVTVTKIFILNTTRYLFCIELVLSIYVTNVIINVSNILGGHLGRLSTQLFAWADKRKTRFKSWSNSGI